MGLLATSEEQRPSKVIGKSQSIHHLINTYCQPQVIVVTTVLIRSSTRRHSTDKSPLRDFKNTKENIQGRGKKKRPGNKYSKITLEKPEPTQQRLKNAE